MRGVGTGVGTRVGVGVAVGTGVGDAVGGALLSSSDDGTATEPEADDDAEAEAVGLPVGEAQAASVSTASSVAARRPCGPRVEGISTQTTPEGRRWLRRQSSCRMGYGCAPDP